MGRLLGWVGWEGRKAWNDNYIHILVVCNVLVLVEEEIDH